jgi:hypothetical protein
LLPLWTLNLGGTDNEQKITRIASKSTIEHVHSQGRVLADRSVLYKYINPNLIAVVTEGVDSIHKCMSLNNSLYKNKMKNNFCLFTLSHNPDIINIYLVDVVSGSIVFSMNHRRAKGPVKIAHSENWLVYTFYNEKIRRNEISKSNSLSMLLFSIEENNCHFDEYAKIVRSIMIHDLKKENILNDVLISLIIKPKPCLFYFIYKLNV